MTATMTETLYRCSSCGAVDTWEAIEDHGCAGRMEAVLEPRAHPEPEVSDNRAMYIAPTPQELREVRKRTRYAAGVVVPSRRTPEQVALAKKHLDEARAAIARAKHPEGRA